MSNRVEELERKIAALEATVDGLTEELVEAKERLSQVEAAADVESEVDLDDDGTAHAEFVPNADRAATASAAAPETDAADGGDAGGSDDAAGGGAEERREEEAGDDSDDDIIVA